MSDANDNIQRSLNEQKKKNLEERYGAWFPPGHNNLSPEAEAEWLDYLQEFERQCEQNEQVTVRAYVGDPMLPSLTSIPPAELHESLERLLDLLAENNIEIDFDREVSDAEAYRFITDELFHVEMDNIRIDGMHEVFIYSEFHPDEVADARRDAELFLNSIFYRDRRMIWHMLTREESLVVDGERCTPESFMVALGDFYHRIESFSSHLFEITSCDIQAPHANLTAALSWAGIDSVTHTPVVNSGVATIRLVVSHGGGWDVVGLSVPGWGRRVC
jgi:hypothetical protein